MGLCTFGFDTNVHLSLKYDSGDLASNWIYALIFEMSQPLPSKLVYSSISKRERCHVASILTLKLTNKATQNMEILAMQTLNPVGDSTRRGAKGGQRKKGKGGKRKIRGKECKGKCWEGMKGKGEEV